jgi:hypothetical protein
MGNFRLRWRALAQALLVSAAVFLASGAALAQVNGFVVVNPIVVCDSNGANCPPFGVLCSTNTTTGAYTCAQSTSPSTATINTPIGFVDGDTNFNLTRAILAAEAGIDVAFFQVRQYNSPNTNVDPWPNITTTGAPTPYSTTSNPTNYQYLHLKTVTCKSGTVQASPDLAALTQHQICTEFGGVKGISNPPPAPSPAPPLGSTLGESNALDVFFITGFPGNVVFGISWINGDGVSIGGPASFLVSGPRFDNLAHEIGHALALDHTTFGIGTNTNNLMTTGSSRTVASTSGCSTTNPYGTNKFPNTYFGVLYDLGDPSVYPFPVPSSFGVQPSGCPSAPAKLYDQLISGATCTALSTCTNQVGALSLSPFINKTLASTATAGGGMLAGVAGAATTSASGSSGAIHFRVDAPAGTGENGDSANSVIIGLPNISGLTFSGSSPATQTGGTPGVTITSQERLNGNSGIGNPNCTPLNKVPSFQCLQIFFSTGANAFVAGDFVTFDLALNKDVGTITSNNLLNGTQFTLVTSTVNTSTAYSTTTTGSMTGGVFSADSRFPDFTTPNQINQNFVNRFVADPKIGPELSKCTPPYVGSGNNRHCPGGTLPTDPLNIIE